MFDDERVGFGGGVGFDECSGESVFCLEYGAEELVFVGYPVEVHVFLDVVFCHLFHFLDVAGGVAVAYVAPHGLGFAAFFLDGEVGVPDEVDVGVRGVDFVAEVVGLDGEVDLVVSVGE